MDSPNSADGLRTPSGPTDPGQPTTPDGGGLKQNKAAHVPSHDTQIIRAKARTQQAEIRAEQAEARTEQAETRTEEAEIRGEQALRASELSYRRLFETAKDGILILNTATGCITDVNPFLFKLLGFSRSEMVGRTVCELSPFKDIESNKVMLERLQKDGYVRYEDLPLETRDGRKIAVEFVSNVYQVGEATVIQCNVRDITERKAAEKERSRLAAIIEYSDEAIISKTVDGIVIGWNHGAEKQYGYTAEEMLGHSTSILFPPDHYQEYLGIMKQVRKGEHVPSFDTVRQRKDGTIVNVSVCFAPIEARDGEIIGASKYSHDITRIKKLEAQFVESQKMEVIGQLAAGVAHDFNNIIAVVMGYSGLILADVGSDSPLVNYAREIRHAAERAAGLTRQLLVFSRKQTVQPIVLDLNDVVQQLDQLLRRLIDENIEMAIVPTKEIGRIKADPGYIGQVLMNLVVNARDAMPNGGKLVIATHNVTLDEDYTRSHPGVTPGDYVMLSVNDTGTGMSDEIKARLFEPFFTTKPQGKGTGLGLPTCQTIVQLSGGNIGVISEPGKGTTFKIYFPRVSQPLDPTARPKQSEPFPRGSETLLVVEDESAVRKLACSVLQIQGYQVLSASNGQEALRVVREYTGPPISLVIADVVMPLMGGKEMSEWLKATYPALKILFTSGYPNEAISRNGALDPDVEFLPKPYTLAALAHKVREMLDAPKAKAAA